MAIYEGEKGSEKRKKKRIVGVIPTFVGEQIWWRNRKTELDLSQMARE